MSVLLENLISNDSVVLEPIEDSPYLLENLGSLETLYGISHVKYTPNQVFDFICRVLNAFGVTIHNSIHFIYGEKHECWPEGHDLTMLLNITYKNKTGWFYYDTACCGTCPPAVYFNGAVKYETTNWSYPYDPIDVARLDAYIHQCTEIGIPWNDLNLYFNSLSGGMNKCDRCGESEMIVFYQCHECSETYRRHEKCEICQECQKTHNPSHVMKRESPDDNSLCIECFDECVDFYYNCQTCVANDIAIIFCQTCARLNNFTKNATKYSPAIVHNSTHNLKEIRISFIDNIETASDIIEKLKSNITKFRTALKNHPEDEFFLEVIEINYKMLEFTQME